MTDEIARGDRPVPPLDAACVQAFIGLARAGFEKREVGLAMVRWGAAVLGAEDGMEAAAERLAFEARDFQIGAVMQAALEAAKREHGDDGR